MTEQYILGEMLDILIEQDTDLKVELTQGVGAAPPTFSLPWRRENSTYILNIQGQGGIWS